MYTLQITIIIKNINIINKACFLRKNLQTQINSVYTIL